MAKEVQLKKGNLSKKGYIGFSWTTLLFGALVPLTRGDWKWAGIILVMNLVSGGLASIFFAFKYNENHLRELLEKAGYEPERDEDRNLLKEAKIYLDIEN